MYINREIKLLKIFMTYPLEGAVPVLRPLLIPSEANRTKVRDIV